MKYIRLVLCVVMILGLLAMLLDEQSKDEGFDGASLIVADGSRDSSERALPVPSEQSPKELQSEATSAAEIYTEECGDALARFEEMVAELRLMHDELPENKELLLQALSHKVAIPAELLPPEADDDAVEPTELDRLFAAMGFNPSEDRQYTVRFMEIQHCAEVSGISEPLLSLVVSTFSAESRPILKKEWLSFLIALGPCQPMVVSAVRIHLQDVIADFAPPIHGGATAYQSVLFFMNRCNPNPSLFGEAMALAKLLEKESERVAYYAWLTAMHPWDENMANLVREGLKDPKLAWSSVELLYFQVGRGSLDAEDMQNFLLSEPESFEALLHGKQGNAAAMAVYKMLAEQGGPWGTDVLVGLMAQQDGGDLSRATVLGFIAQSEDPSFDWAYLKSFLTDADAAVSGIAWEGIGMRAATNDEAYEWLRLEATQPVDSKRQFEAVYALGMSGRPEVAEELWTGVIQTSTDAAVKTQAARMYSTQPGADIERLKELADYRSEPDVSVRQSVAMDYIMASRDLDKAAGFVEGLMSDPDLGMYATYATGLYLEQVKGDEESLAKWGQMKPTGFDLATTAMSWAGMSPDELMTRYASAEFGAAISRRHTVDKLMNLERSPLFQFQENESWFKLQLHEISKKLQKE